MENDKIFRYRGKTKEDLVNMEFNEFVKLLPSRLRRKVKRGFTEEEKKLIDKVQKGKKKIRTHCRDMFVIPIFFDKKIEIHNGKKEFVQINIIEEMVGVRLGELAPTRKIGVKHGGKQDATQKGKNPKPESGGGDKK